MGNSGMVIQSFTFHSSIVINLYGMDEEDLYETMVERIVEKIATFQSMGSIIQLELHTVKYKPLNGKNYIPLPKALKVKKGIINIKNSDNQCFLWCVLKALNPRDRDQEKVDAELKEKENTFNKKGIEYPVSLKDLNKFEKQNPSISITVLSH